jgi:hypothetical protein
MAAEKMTAAHRGIYEKWLAFLDTVRTHHFHDVLALRAELPLKTERSTLELNLLPGCLASIGQLLAALVRVQLG